MKTAHFTEVRLVVILSALLLTLPGAARAEDVFITGNVTHQYYNLGNDSLTVTSKGNLTVSNQNVTAVRVDGGSITVVQGGVLNLTNNTVTRYGDVDSGGAIYANTGNVNLSGNTTFSGNRANDYGGAIFANNNITIAGNTTFSGNTASEGGAIYLAGGATAALDTTDGTISFATASDTIGGAGGLTITGTGTVTLNAGNTYTGGTNISGGTVNANAVNAFGTGSVAMSGGTVNANAAPFAGKVTLSGGTVNANVSNVFTSQNLVMTAGVINAGVANVFSGNMNLDGGTVNAASIDAFGNGSTTLGPNAVLNFGNMASGTPSGTFAGTGTVTSAGNLTLTSPSTFSGFTGDFAVKSGSLTLGEAGQTYLSGLSGFTLANGATLGFTANQIGGSSTPLISLAGGTVNLESGSHLFATIGPSLAAEKTGEATYTFALFNNAGAGSTFNADMATSNTLYTMRNGVFSNGRYTVDLYRKASALPSVPESVNTIIDSDYNPLEGKGNVWLDKVFEQKASGPTYSTNEQARAVNSGTQAATLSGAAAATRQIGSVFRNMIPSLASGGISPLSSGGVVAISRPSGMNGGDDIVLAGSDNGNTVAGALDGPRFAIWATPLFRQESSWGHVGANDDVSLTTRVYGGLLGASVTFGSDNQFTAGSLFTTGKAFTKSHGDLAETTNDARYVGGMLYGQWRPVKPAELTAYAGITHVANNVEQDNVATLSSDFDSTLYQFGGIAEYTFGLTGGDNPWNLVPGIGIDVQHYRQDGFTTRMYDRSVYHTGAYDSTLMDLPVTLKLRKTFLPDELNTFKFETRAGYRPTIVDFHQRMNWKLAGGTTTASLTGSDMNDHHSGMAGAGIGWSREAFSLKLDYDVDFGRSHVDHTVSAQLKWEF